MTIPQHKPVVAPRSWKRRAARWVAVTLLGFILTFVVWNLVAREWTRTAGRRDLAAVVAATDQDDPAWRWEELNATRLKPPAGRNGADVITRVRALLPQEWVRDADPEKWEPDLGDLPPNVRPFARTVAEARKVLDRAGPALAVARTLKDCPFGHRDIDLKPDVLSTLLPDTRHTPTVGHVLRVDALVAAEDQNTARLRDDLFALLNASRSIGDEPFLISQVTRLATRMIALRTLERALAQTPLDPATLAALQAAWAADAEEPLLLNGLRGDRAAYDVFFKNLTDGTIDPGYLTGPARRANSLDSPGWWLARAHLPADHAYYLRWTTQAVAVARRPPEEQLAAVQSLPAIPPSGPNVRFSLLLLPAAEKVTTATVRGIAEARCAAVGLACERFRLEHHRWPDTLAALVPGYLSAVPLDPYTGDFLLYVKANAGVAVFAACGFCDATGVFDFTEGTPPTLARFRLWNPEHRRQPPLPEAPAVEPDP